MADDPTREEFDLDRPGLAEVGRQAHLPAPPAVPAAAARPPTLLPNPYGLRERRFAMLVAGAFSVLLVAVTIRLVLLPGLALAALAAALVAISIPVIALEVYPVPLTTVLEIGADSEGLTVVRDRLFRSVHRLILWEAVERVHESDSKKDPVNIEFRAEWPVGFTADIRVSREVFLQLRPQFPARVAVD